MINFEYGVCPISDLQVITERNAKNKIQAKEVILPDGRGVAPTDRFWKSLQMRFKFNDTMFKYFPHEESFKRISEVSANDEVRWCIEKGKTAKLLSVTNPKNPIIEFGNLAEILAVYNSEKVDYSDGVVRSTHVPRVQVNEPIGGDTHENRFVIDCPIDGFGKPHVYLGLLRLVCVNGAIAFHAGFRSELNVGKGNDTIEQSLKRALEGFNNEEGFSALRVRFNSATQSFASVSEAMLLYRLIMKTYNNKDLLGVKVMKIGGTNEDVSFYDNIAPLKDFMNMTGELNRHYGLTNLDTLSPKRQKVLPTRAAVYDLLNFASELATHHMTARGARTMQAYIGTMLNEEYDLEGTKNKFGDWKDIFIERKETSTAVTEMSQTM